LKLFIYSADNSPRLKYITKLVLDELIGVDCEIITESEEVYTKEFVVNYSSKDSVGLQIIPSKILFEKRISHQELNVGEKDGFATLFSNKNSDFGFDIFGAAFFLVTRYEEYMPHKRDKHDRFDPEHSVAFKNGFLNQPIINIWAAYLKKKLQEKYPKLEFKNRSFSYINTIDVDYAYAYLEKGVIRSVGALARDFFTGNFSEFKHRLSCFVGLRPDPFDTFSQVLELHKSHKLRSIFFFHVGDYDVHDKSIPITSNKLQALIKGVKDYADVGIHPSYSSNCDAVKLESEIIRLSKVVHQPITKSRNHFIKLNLPQSYRALIELDVTEDYTMGYASKMGFRAGICNPFYFYDLDYDSPTSLRVYPFYLMEATIKYYFNEGPDKAMKYFKEYIDIVKKYNGTFVSLWHNDSISEWGQWKGWSKIYEEMLEYVGAESTSD